MIKVRLPLGRNPADFETDPADEWPRLAGFLHAFILSPRAQGICYRRRITAVSSQEIARYITEDTMARMVIPVITMFILKICAPY